MVKIVRLRTKPDRIRREAAEALAEQIELWPASELPETARASLLNELYRLTHPDDELCVWPGGFVMLSRRQVAAIWDAIRALPGSARPNKVRHAFDIVILNIRHDTGEVMLTRDEISERMGITRGHTTEVMRTLERMGVIRTERRPIAGARGPGRVVYFLNPHVAWSGRLDIRKAEAKLTPPPQLKLVGGEDAKPQAERAGKRARAAPQGVGKGRAAGRRAKEPARP